MVVGRVRIPSGSKITGGSRVPKKALGQHWLKDRRMLERIADSLPLGDQDTVLEIGPGLGTLTSVLLGRVERVIAVEYDAPLARKLPGQFPGKNLTVVQADILTYNLNTMPKGYKVVANVPYYITQKILEHMLRSFNQPAAMALLVQQEVADKLAAGPGKLTPVAVKTQLHYDILCGTRVPKEYFTPPPNVDSQVVICTKKHVDKYVETNQKDVWRVIDAGFSTPRKKLKTALAGGLGLAKDDAESLCRQADIAADERAADVPVGSWVVLARLYGSR